MIEQDTLQRFVFQSAQIRGEIVRLHASYSAVLERYAYPQPIVKLLGESMAAAALLSATIKTPGSLTLQVQSQGPLNLLVVQSDESYHLRALARWDGELPSHSLPDLLGIGQLVITMAPTEGSRYQGVVDLNADSLSGILENYFDQSEQLPTCLCLFAEQPFAVGFLLQAMPSDQTSAGSVQPNFWQEAVHVAKALREDDWFQLSNQEILQQLYPQEQLQFFETEPVSFRCKCTLDRMERALRLVSYDEVKMLLKTNRFVTVTCEFCHHHYEFDSVDIEKIFSGGTIVTGTNTQH